MNPWILERNCSLLPGRPDVIVNHSRSERDAVTPAPADAVSIALVKLLRGIISRLSHVATGQVAQSCPPNWLNSWPRSTAQPHRLAIGMGLRLGATQGGIPRAREATSRPLVSG